MNLLSAPEGIIAFKEKFPRLRIVTAFVDEGLDHRKYIIRSDPCLTLGSLFLDVATLGTDSSERIIEIGVPRKGVRVWAFGPFRALFTLFIDR